MKWFLERAKEPSSMASLSGVAAGLEVGIQTGNWSLAATGIIAGLMGFITKEKAKVVA